MSAVGSTVIALCALFATAWQAWTTHCHNRLSVRPHLTTWETLDIDAGTYQLKIMNNGIGPAVINDFSFFVDGQLVPGKGADLLTSVLERVLVGKEYDFSQNYLSSSYVMPAKEERTLLDLRFRTAIPTEEEFNELRKRVRLYIAYTDMYKDTMKPFDSNVVT